MVLLVIITAVLYNAPSR